MKRILSTGTGMKIATATGDAGQMGMVAAFLGARIRLLVPASLGANLCQGRERPWRAPLRWLQQSLGFKGAFAPGDRRFGYHYSPLPIQHSVYQG
ncbi:hypothetical protein IQ254_26390 [Nodosilinea sp. LEGE 07088]|uniref:hypothetical protein n=1 Tax=Nodosilinea sp. LEGE 07088 TaxID=2777968 RepID=UPI00188088F4|nr:hypothetical protein [Nodosilinea sp. LEGE 07088]MBE9140688.1 hypothetical protein [Nodosilinea sp. LEGE 07088]